MSPAEEQTVAMALAHLSVERPGFKDHAREIADSYLEDGGTLFDHFYKLRSSAVELQRRRNEETQPPPSPPRPET